MKIEFKIIDSFNKEEVLKLNVKSSQRGFVETIKECLDESDELSLWRPTAIYVDNILVGFAMYGFWKYEGDYGRVWLDRFLIDEHYQGHGYAKPILSSLINKIIEEYKCKEIYLSLYEDNEIACKIYKKLGFDFNGELDINGEKVMVLGVL